jgi:mercuric reductase
MDINKSTKIILRKLKEVQKMADQESVNITLKVEGMTCSHCNVSVESALKKLDGVIEAQADYEKGNVEVKYIEGRTSVDDLISAINKSGYRASLPGKEVEPKKSVRQEKPISEVLIRENNQFDIVILGGGSAAFAAAIKASELRAKVAVGENRVIGGTCLNRGCVPTKNMLKAAELYHSAKRNGFKGVNLKQGSLDLAEVIAQKDELITEMRKVKYWDILEAYPNIKYFSGKAEFLSENEVKIGDEILKADRFIIATGASPWIPPIEGIEEVSYITSDEALELKKLPESMVIIGANAVGLEFSQMFARFGTKVILLEAMPKIAPGEEEEISLALKEYLEEEGIDVYTRVNVVRVKNDGKYKVSVTDINGKQRVEFRGEELLIATGRRGNTQGLGLERIGIEVDKKGFVKVNDEMETSIPYIFAAGDVVGKQQLVTLAALQGSVAAENALNETHRKVDYSSVPYAIFTDPEVASVGLKEKEAIEKGYRVKTTVLDMKLVPKAALMRDTRGLVKMIVEEGTNRVLGVHILSPQAADIIHKAVLLVKYRMTIQDVLDTMDVYPTLSESIKVAAQSFVKDVTKLSCCAE